MAYRLARRLSKARTLVFRSLLSSERETFLAAQPCSASAGPSLLTTSLSRHRIHSTGSAGFAWSKGFRTSALKTEEIRISVPQMGDSISEGSVASLEHKPGDVINEDDVLLQIETDKVTIDVRYTESEPGTVKEYLVGEDDTVTVGQEVCVVDKGAVEKGDEGGSQEDSSPDDKKKTENKKPDDKGKSEPKGKSDDASKQSGKKQAPAKADQKVEERPPREAEAPKEPTKKAPPSQDGKDAAIPSSKSVRPERRVKITRLRARVAERLKGAQNTYAMLTTFNEIDMTNLMQLRSTYKEGFIEKHGVKLGFMSAFVKASADALHLVPAVNAVIDEDEIVYRDFTDISIAVATPKGLVVPVLRSVDSKSFAEIEKNINELGRKARDGTIGIDDMAGGTFTISNGGVYGSLLSTPIINPPQSAILGMHSINQRPLVIGKDILPRPVMNVALTYDHRLIDGREAVTFLKRVKDVVENPVRLLLDV